MPLYLYILRRVLFVIPLLLGITLVSFVIANAVPADPINANLPTNQLNNPEIVAAFRAKWGLDKPPIEQYLTYLGNLLHGDFGTSIKTHQPIVNDIAQFLPATIELATVGTVFGVLIGVVFGLVSAVWQNRPIDFIVRTVGLIGVSVPVFVLALVGLAVLHGQLGWSAGTGRLSARMIAPATVTGFFTVDSLIAGQWNIFRDALSHLILPSLVLGLYIAGLISRVTRSSMLEVLSADYMRTARAKGLARTVRRAAARPLERPAADCDGDRPVLWQSALRRGADRIDLRLAGHRALYVSRIHIAGFPGDYGCEYLDRLYLRGGESNR